MAKITVQTIIRCTKEDLIAIGCFANRGSEKDIETFFDILFNNIGDLAVITANYACDALPIYDKYERGNDYFKAIEDWKKKVMMDYLNGDLKKLTPSTS